MNTTLQIITGLWGGDKIHWPAPTTRDVTAFTTLDGLKRQIDSMPGRTGKLFAAIPNEEGGLEIKSFTVSEY